MRDKKILNTIQQSISKSKILEIAKDLGLVVSPTDRTAILVDLILEDTEENGVPEFEEMSKDMLEFYCLAGIVNDKGEIIEESVSDVEETLEEDSKEEQKKLPDCFGMADELDPSCKRCTVLQGCMKKRDSNLPECYGLLYERNDNECQLCIVATLCKKSMSERKS